MPTFLEDLETAFKNISSEHYQSLGLRPNGESYMQYPETSFNFQLTFNFERLKNNPNNEERYRNLSLTPDRLKFGIDPPLKPDLVLHGGGDNQQKQALYVEVKIDPRADLDKDLRALKRAISDELNFENAILIVANKSLNSTSRVINKFVQNNELELSKLHLFHAVIENDRINYLIVSFEELND
jgi:hypothetical protein